MLPSGRSNATDMSPINDDDGCLQCCNNYYPVSSRTMLLLNKGLTCTCRAANYGLAQSLYHKCCLQQPQDMQILSNLAAVYLCQENWLEALKHSQNGLDIKPEHIKCCSHHGVAATNLGQYIRAICDLTLAQKLVMLLCLHLMFSSLPFGITACMY